LVLFVTDEGASLAERLDSVKHKMGTTLLVVAVLVLTSFAALSGTKPAKAAAPDQAPGARWPPMTPLATP
jgi:hypothetical protein